MAEATFDSLFGSSVLEVITPDTSVSFPDDVSLADEWLASIREPRTERKQAFFDEQLNLLVVMEMRHPLPNTPPDHSDPPRRLVEFLSHVQVSLEAMYISQQPSQDRPEIASLVPPRTSSMPNERLLALHPSIFPPTTPNPIPSTAEVDRRYVQSEGTMLFSSIWGTRKPPEQSQERFALLFSEARGSWIAVYELSLIVSYLRLPFSDPLLCLTASTTLRDKALSFSQTSHPLVSFLVRKNMIPQQDPGTEVDGESGEEDSGDDETGFEEVNLLEGLSTVGPSMSPESEPLHLPSSRLGNITRRRLFTLPPVSTSTDAPAPPPSSKRGPNHILRKSFRKILQTVSGFRVRMRTVFVPHVLLPKDPSAPRNDIENDDFESGNEEREAGNSERTVVLCVEVENSGESGPTIGFSLERLDVKISGEGVTARLIGWGEGAFNPDIEKQLFPLLVGSMEQYNILYVVFFWNTPNDQDLSLMGRSTVGISELERAVTLTVYGRPYLTGDKQGENTVLSYPTQTFSSRWNCILDLSSRPRDEPVDFYGPSGVGRSALPEPPSPFPGRTAVSSVFPPPQTGKLPPQAIAGKRHTLPGGGITAMRAINPSANSRLSLPPREHAGSPSIPVQAQGFAFTPPSIAFQAFNRSPSTTYGMTPMVPPPPGAFGTPPMDLPAQAFVTPPTPAYPAFPPNTQSTGNMPQIHALGTQQASSGPSMDVRRERGLGMSSPVPQTPLPMVLGGQTDHRVEPSAAPSGEPVVVSVGLLPAESGESKDDPFGPRMIYPSDQFTLDIFVFNQSSWTRRFEVSYSDADKRQRRKIEQSKATTGSKGKVDLEEIKASICPPGILPLQNRVRVGPLRPSTCQSVRMDFLAISPGVHSVDILTLTDIESGYAVNLRSVLDIVVHERRVEESEPSGFS